MSRSEALAPLKAGEGRFTVTAGIAIRGSIRRGALSYGLDYYEEKGWLDSVFIIRGSANRVVAFKDAIAKTFGDE